MRFPVLRTGGFTAPVYPKDKYYEKLPVDGAGNVYLGGTRANSNEKDAYVDGRSRVTIHLVEKGGKTVLDTNLYELLPDRATCTVSTTILGEAFESEQLFEDPQGREIIFNEDYFGSHRGIHPLPGPFETKEAAQQELF